MTAGGVILCGGQSRRMGRPKVTLPFGRELMLLRVVRLLGEAVAPVVVVGGPRQRLPSLPPEVRVARDRRSGRGPLEGIAAGLRALPAGTDAAFVTACDVPLLKPEFVRRMVELAEGFDAAVPHVGGFDEPLSAVYRTSVLPEIENLLAEGWRRTALLCRQVRARRVTAEELADVDPDLDSLRNTNTPDDYRAALAKAQRYPDRL
jgi:molybdopterin-guanine dinucleotide biosynthesis protein A